MYTTRMEDAGDGYTNVVLLKDGIVVARMTLEAWSALGVNRVHNPGRPGRAVAMAGADEPRAPLFSTTSCN
jgi:hypothetical protein